MPLLPAVPLIPVLEGFPLLQLYVGLLLQPPYDGFLLQTPFDGFLLLSHSYCDELLRFSHVFALLLRLSEPPSESELLPLFGSVKMRQIWKIPFLTTERKAAPNQAEGSL